jgi:hypothetical protein
MAEGLLVAEFLAIAPSARIRDVRYIPTTALADPALTQAQVDI